MEAFLETIRLAIAHDANDQAKAAGAEACRSILATLHPAPVAPPTPPIAELANAVAALRGVPTTQLLDLAIAKLRTMVPPDQAGPVRSIKIPILQVPRANR